MKHQTIALAIAVWATAGARASAAPHPAQSVPVAVGLTFEQKMAWILRLEDQRMLRDPIVPAPPPPLPLPLPPAPVTKRGQKPVVVPTPSPSPPPPPADLLRLLTDEEARVRRRSALAVGRVGLVEGVDPLVALLADLDPEVKQMAAFALGLIGDRRASDPLVRALNDPAPGVKASAAEALGLIGDPAATVFIGAMITQVVQSGAVTPPPGDEEIARRDTPAAAFRLGLMALVRLKAFDQVAASVLDGDGQPRVRWWPVAFALQRLEAPRASTALLTLAREPHPYTRAFAVKGLGALKVREAVPVLLPLVTSGDRAVAYEAIRALGRIGDPAASAALVKILQDRTVAVHMRAEAMTAIGALKAPGPTDLLLDLLADTVPQLRAAALAALATYDPDTFVTALSGLDSDPDWTVRAALASVLGSLDSPTYRDIGLDRLASMLSDSDSRVIPAVLNGLARRHAPNVAAVLLEHLKDDDPAVRAAAAAGVGELKPEGGAAALVAAFDLGQRDATYIARAAAMVALTKYGAAPAKTVLETGLSDRDWAVRVRAAALMKEIEPSSDADHRIRPSPLRMPVDAYRTPRLIVPSVSTQVYLDTDRGTIHIELGMLDAPLTVENFVQLARGGFFNGSSLHRVVPNFVVQTGDPRGDGEGGPGYTIRDELNQLPYVRGTVGMALDWADTGGSQFFITHSPQPHLDAKYTVIGRVVEGMDVVDQVAQGDTLRRVRVWDGETMSR